MSLPTRDPRYDAFGEHIVWAQLCGSCGEPMDDADERVEAVEGDGFCRICRTFINDGRENEDG